MISRNVRLVFMFSVMALLVTGIAPFGTQHAMLPPDPEGESTVAYTMTNSSGDPTGTLSAAYVLDDTSLVFNADGVFDSNQTGGFRADLNPDNNTYSVTTISSGTFTPTELPPVWGASVALYTLKNDTGAWQVRTIDALSWVISQGTVGSYCYTDDYHVFPTSVTGGLTWTIAQGTPNPPYTTSPYTNIINDVWGKYKNFNYGDPNLVTATVHVISLGHFLSDPDYRFRYSISGKMKNEGKRDFHFEWFYNENLCQP